MKTQSLPVIIAGASILTLLLFASVQTCAQQVITFTNGSVMRVFITYQTKDTVKYYKEGYPHVIYGETMDHILKIVPAEPLNVQIPENQQKVSLDDKEAWKYKKNITTGGILLGTGAVLGLAGIAGWSSTHNAENADQVLGVIFSVMGMAMGSGLLLTGTILVIVNSSNLAMYRKERGLTLDIKCTPQVSGVSLVYRF